MKESDLFYPIKSWLESQDFEVFSEVVCQKNGKRADIVATRRSLIVVVEQKTSMSLALLEQCIQWKPYAHYVYGATPCPKRVSDTGHFFCKHFGIGLLSVRASSVSVPVTPKMSRKISDKLKLSLCEEQKYGPVGGSAGGGYVTPYALTMMRVKEFLQKNGWADISEITRNVPTHYAGKSAKLSLRNALLSFEHDWCESKVVKNTLLFRVRNCVLNKEEIDTGGCF